MVDLKKLREKNIELTRKAVKHAVTRDLLVIQAISCIEEIDKVCSTLVNRLREWYGYYNPELAKSIHSNEKFTKLITTRSKKELLDSINIDEQKSMGADLDKKDVDAVLELAKSVNNKYHLRKYLENYLENTMQEICPNINAITGPLIGAKLVSFAGSLKRLSEMPASTIQLLGAEKALFRHIRGQGKSPKHGILVQHPLMERAKVKDRGKIARGLADKISIAAKVDYFKGDFVGDNLIAQLEARFK